MDGSKSKNRVAVWGLVILIATVWLLPFLLVVIAPSLMWNDIRGGVWFSSIVGVVGLVIGIMVGLKLPTTKERLMNALAIGVFALIFVHIAVVPSNRIGLQSVLQWGLVLAVAPIVGALLGGLKKR